MTNDLDNKENNHNTKMMNMLAEMNLVLNALEKTKAMDL
jgi:hypothetical protein